MTTAAFLFGAALVLLGTEESAIVDPSERGCRWSESWSDDVQTGPLRRGLAHPEKTHHKDPEWPEDESSPHAGRVGSGVIILEVLVDDDGSVADVGFLRHTQWDPPWPEFDEAAATAIRQWKYDPATLEGTPVPFCVTVTVNINFK